MVTDLPFIDEFDATVEAPPSQVFSALTRAMDRTFSGAAGQVFTAVLGCLHRGASYTVPPVEGQEVNGFRVARVEAPSLLVLEGQHRFAIYRLTLRVEGVGPDRSRLSARTDAAFPGLTGRLYRLGVIGTGGHAMIAKRMLSAVARRAERDRRVEVAP